MAELKVEIVKIASVHDHPNADRMELAFVGGYQVCVQKDSFHTGELAVYIPVDSLLEEDLESLIFGPDSKVKLNKHRVRCIKLRGAMSQGMLLPLVLVAQYPGAQSLTYLAEEGLDCTKALHITKYTPPESKKPSHMVGGAAPKRHHHPMFSKYTSINHLKKYWNAFNEGEDIYNTEKIHGTNFRAGWVPFVPRTFWQKVKNIFGLNKPFEFVYGSHNVQLMDGSNRTKGGSPNNVYKRIVVDHHLEYKIPRGQLWYGEIFGDGIQKGYEYSFSEGKVDVAWMDIKIVDSAGGRYLDFGDVIHTVQDWGQQVVPYSVGKYNADDILSDLNDPSRKSFIDGKTAPIEGFVVRPRRERSFYGGRLILKVLSDKYLLKKDGTDWK
jgi:RNA ligase (TIGR02306 family)